MAPRFCSSPYKNAVAQIPKKDGWWAELPVSTSAHSDSTDLIKASSEYWLAQGSSSGSLVCVPYDTPAKFNNKAPTLQVASRSITDFDVSQFDDLVVAGTEDGKITTTVLPPLASFASSSGAISPPSSPLALSLVHPSQTSIDVLQFHSTSFGLFLAASNTIVAVYDIESQSLSPAYSIDLASPVWSSKWSPDGRSISVTSKDGFLRVYDVRSSSATPTLETSAHSGTKSSRHVWISPEQIFTTGFSKTRDREYSLFDVRNPGVPIKSQRVDTNTGVLMPIVDAERGIVYLGGRGDMTVRWVEVGGPSILTEGATFNTAFSQRSSANSKPFQYKPGGTPIPTTLAGFALAPPSLLNLMKAEINRLVVLTTDAVVPIPIEVPRRQYIDFHSDLFPPRIARVPAQTGESWRKGGDAQRALVEQDPNKKAMDRMVVALPTLVSEPIKSAQTPATIATPAPISSTPTHTSSTPTPAASLPPIEALNVSDKVSTPIPTPSDTPTSPAILPPPTSSTTATPFNLSWSRKFLTGKTPLKPDYQDIHGVSATMTADVQMIKANHLYFFFPLSGAGGRLGAHALADKGRMPTNGPSLNAGAGIVDFELDPFDPSVVFVASDDSKISVFEIPEKGPEGEESIGAGRVLSDSKMDKIVAIKHHPTAKGLLLSVSDDHGAPCLRLWNTATGALALKVELPSTFGAISSVAWSPDGTYLAIATKSKLLHVLDPRSPISSPIFSCSSHDSPRPIHVTWLSSSHLITTGFSKSATREAILYELGTTEITRLATQPGDVSPSPFFPFVDLDTHILFLYSRGERSCHAFEVQPGEKIKFSPLPSFENGTLQVGFAFLPKKRNDVTKAEVLRALRLTTSTVEIVSFSVPRARLGYFQDDIFVPTRDVETASVSGEEWLAGENVPLHRVELCPAGMTPLSKAPAIVTKGSTRSNIAGPVVTESQKQEAYLQKLFNAAKEDGDEEILVRSSHAPVDDDW